MAPSFEVLPGLPGDGPYPDQFTTKGGTHREGFVVRVIPDHASPWVGNFQPGCGGISRVVLHADGSSLLVFSRGLAYAVDPETRSLVVPVVADGVRDVLVFPEHVVLAGQFLLTVLGPGFRRWQTPYAAWYDFKDIRIEGPKLLASGWHPLDEVWQPIELDLGDGNIAGSGDGRVSVPSNAPTVWQALRSRLRRLLRARGA